MDEHESSESMGEAGAEDVKPVASAPEVETSALKNIDAIEQQIVDHEAARLDQAVLLAKLGIPPLDVVRLSLDERSELVALLENIEPAAFFQVTKLAKTRALFAVPTLPKP